MYLYVSVQNKNEYYKDGAGGGKVKARLEQASGERCLIVPFEEFNLNVVREYQPNAIAMSGFGNHFHAYSPESFLGMNEVFQNTNIPMICFCGSHQLLAFAYHHKLDGTTVLQDEPIRLLEPSEDLPRRAKGGCFDVSNHYMADGFFPIRMVKDDPIFAGMPEIMMMRCAHYCEVKSPPENFEILARSGHCRIEAMRHREKPIYGTQFHPEAYEEPFFDGKKLLENFARIAKNHRK